VKKKLQNKLHILCNVTDLWDAGKRNFIIFKYVIGMQIAGVLNLKNLKGIFRFSLKEC